MNVSWNMSGIYKITNKVNKKSYIGRTTNFLKRFESHQKDLENNKHHNSEFQAEYNIYGDDNFTFDIIEILENFSNSREREDFYIKEYAESGTYNISNPLHEWNNFIDNNSFHTIYDKLEEYKKISLSEYEKFKDELDTNFNKPFDKIAETLYMTGDLIYYDQLIEEIQNRLNTNTSFFLPLAIKKILDRKDVYTIYTNKHKKAFNKAGIYIKNDTYIHIHRRKFLEIYDIFRNKEAKKIQSKKETEEGKIIDAEKERKKERKILKDNYIDEVRRGLIKRGFNFEKLLSENIKEKGFLLFNDLTRILEDMNISCTEEINKEEREDALKRYFRKEYNVSIFNWKTYEELLSLIKIDKNKISKTEDNIITERNTFNFIGDIYKKSIEDKL